MIHDNPELIDQLAAEYVLGTLRGAARRRFERLCAKNEIAAAAVKRWEDDLFSLGARVRPMQPGAEVWAHIEQRLKLEPASGARKRRATWPLAAAAALLLAIAIGWGVYLRSPAFDTVAVVAQADRKELWHIEVSRDQSQLRVRASADVPLDPSHAYELWALPDSGAAPVSLGVIPARGEARHALTEQQRAALASSSKIAVSQEPPGGSPTGAPTGPVLHVAPITARA